MAARTGKKSRPHVGEQVLIPRQVVLVEPFRHDPRVDQLAEPVGQRVPTMDRPGTPVPASRPAVAWSAGSQYASTTQP